MSAKSQHTKRRRHEGAESARKIMQCTALLLSMLVMHARVALQHLNLNRTLQTPSRDVCLAFCTRMFHAPCAAHSIALDYYKVNDTTEKRDREKKRKQCPYNREYGIAVEPYFLFVFFCARLLSRVSSCVERTLVLLMRAHYVRIGMK